MEVRSTKTQRYSRYHRRRKPQLIPGFIREITQRKENCTRRTFRLCSPRSPLILTDFAAHESETKSFTTTSTTTTTASPKDKTPHAPASAFSTYSSTVSSRCSCSTQKGIAHSSTATSPSRGTTTTTPSRKSAQKSNHRISIQKSSFTPSSATQTRHYRPRTRTNQRYRYPINRLGENTFCRRTYYPPT